MSKYIIQAIFSIIFIALMGSKGYSLHIIGGDVIYECQGIDVAKNEVTFKITFTMYRDSKSAGAQFDTDANFGIFRGNGNSWSHFRTIGNVSPKLVEDIPIETNNPCIIVPVNVGVQKGVYEFTIKLPISSQSYQIAYQRCCRNTTILNLVAPGDAGAAFTTIISPEAQSSCNNSPKFNNFPPVVICVNRPIDFDHSATDIDGDSLVYEFCTPLTAGGKDGSGPGGGDAEACTGVRPNPANCLPPFETVTFRAPTYTFDQPMAGNPLVEIDRITGLIFGSPNILNQHVVGVCVKEYRNGVLIGELRRDFQFNVAVCETAVMADIKATGKTPTEYFINSCGEYTVNFINESTDTRYIQNYNWEFNIGNEVKIYNTRNVSITFPGLGQYTAKMLLNKGIAGGACSDSASIIVNIYPDIEADFEYKYDTCVSGPIEFIDKSVSGAGAILKWGWDFSEGNALEQNPSFEYETPGNKVTTLIVEDVNQCRDTITEDIRYYPLPAAVVIDPNTFTGCKPADIFFKNLTKPIDDTYDLTWNFGDGSDGSKLYSPTHRYEEEGIYTVTLDLVSPLGCRSQKVWNQLIKVVPSPTAGFSFKPEVPTIIENTVEFTDESIDAVSYLWQFDSTSVSNLSNPTHTFKDTGTYIVKQIVLHPSGCSDTATAIIYIAPFIKFYMPNAFTPNEDGLNDTYIPIGLFEGIREYNMTIWNRWGEQVFESKEPVDGWNGFSQNNGAVAPTGVYVYNVSFKDGFGKTQKLKGHVTLVR